MGYWSAGIAHISDVKRFVEATKGWAGAKVREYGATDLNDARRLWWGTGRRLVTESNIQA